MESKERTKYLSQAEDRLRRVSRSGRPDYLQFADPALRTVIDRQVLPHFPDCHIVWNGGFTAAERQAGGIWRDDSDELDIPICAVSFSWDARYGSPEHRDILGSLLGCGFQRERVGDIILASGKGWCVISRDIADYLIANWVSAGRVRLRGVSYVDFEQIEKKEKTVRIVRDTVSSMRLDAVLSRAFRASRATAVKWIAAGRVKVNWLECYKCDQIICAGDWLSVRGMGRAQLYEIGQKTQKGRVWIVIHCLSDREKQE